MINTKKRLFIPEGSVQQKVAAKRDKSGTARKAELFKNMKARHHKQSNHRSAIQKDEYTGSVKSRRNR